MTYRLRIADIPLTERPRERLLVNGSKILATAELIAILLGTGQGAGKLSAVGLGQLLLQELGKDQRDPMSVLRDVSATELMQISGVGPAKATTILAAVELGKRVFQARPNDRTPIESPGAADRYFKSRSDVGSARKICCLVVGREKLFDWDASDYYWDGDGNFSTTTGDFPRGNSSRGDAVDCGA